MRLFNIKIVPDSMGNKRSLNDMGPKNGFHVGENYIEKQCRLISCNKKFMTKSKKAKYCSNLCRWTAWSRRHPRK